MSIQGGELQSGHTTRTRGSESGFWALSQQHGVQSRSTYLTALLLSFLPEVSTSVEGCDQFCCYLKGFPGGTVGKESAC